MMEAKAATVVYDKVDYIIEKYDQDESSLVPLLLDVQEEFNWLPREALEKVSSRLDVPLTQLFHITTFYKTFSLTPRGRHQLSLCMGTACHVRGAPLLRDHLEQKLELESGQTSSDFFYTLETVNCVGACALGPILIVDGEYHGEMTIPRINKMLNRLEKKTANGQA